MFMQYNMKKTKRFLRLRPPRMSKEAVRVLIFGLPFISTSLIALTLKMQSELPSMPVTVIRTYPAMYEHILASLTLLILGAMIFDIMAKNKK